MACSHGKFLLVPDLNNSMSHAKVIRRPRRSLSRRFGVKGTLQIAGAHGEAPTLNNLYVRLTQMTSISMSC